MAADHDPDDKSLASGLLRPSFFEGGGFERLLQWAHLSGNTPGRVRRRVVVIVLVAWLPLLVFTAFAGQLIGDGTVVPFALDVEVHVRFLLALPLLLFGQVEVDRRLPWITDQFVERRLLSEQTLPRFDAARASAARLSKSLLADLLIAALVYGVGVLVLWRRYLVLDAATWYGTASPTGPVLTAAGIWYGCVSMPLMQFLLLGLYWRVFLWARFLWQVSRIKLNLMPAYPDRTGGLGFLAQVAPVYAMFALAIGAIASGHIAGRIFFTGATLSQFAEAIAGLVLWMVSIVCGPLLFFAGQLREAKQAGLNRYGKLAERYVRGFDGKWLPGREAAEAVGEEGLLGTADIQSLADLANSYEVVQTMRVSPVSREMLLHLALATLAPLAPLLLTVLPLSELLKMVFGVAH